MAWTGPGQTMGGSCLGDSAVRVAAGRLEVRVKVFVSSVISGMQVYRAAARQAAETLGHTVIAAEDFGAPPLSPQQVCLASVRAADVVVLLLGARSGAAQAAGLSPAHEEYRDTRRDASARLGAGGRHPRVRSGEPRPGGEHLGGRRLPPGLQHARLAGGRGDPWAADWELSQQDGPADYDELMTRAVGLLPTRSAHAAGVAPLHVVVAGAPVQQVLRPSALDGAALHRDMQREAVYGDHPVFDPQQGVQEPVVHGTTLLIAPGECPDHAR